VGEWAGGQASDCDGIARAAQIRHLRYGGEEDVSLSYTPSFSFYSSLDSAKLHYLATNKKKRR
jgi:hypothetical protein